MNDVLQVNDLCVDYPIRGSHACVHAVQGVSFNLGEGETLGIVGESGCGKTSVGNAIVGQLAPTSGEILFNDPSRQGHGPMTRAAFCERVQMVFQDPMGSLNPRMTIGRALEEVLYVHRKRCSLPSGDARKKEVVRLLDDVGLASSFVQRYPHELSGGQRQRVVLARALAVRPTLLIADEPVSALDVSIQVQILNLIKDLQERMNLALLFIAHDLSVVRYMCDRVVVMYQGLIVEEGRRNDLFIRAAHPYTEALLSAVPTLGLGDEGQGWRKQRIVLKGEPATNTTLATKCPFLNRCHRAEPACHEWVPTNQDIGEGHTSLCRR